ncbi:MAG: FCD domain-containing protein [Thermomonas sp.]
MISEKSIPAQIIELIHAEALEVGSHLPAQMLADRLKISRSPINQALGALHKKGILSREPNRGYFLAVPITQQPAQARRHLALDETDAISAVYFRIADDRLTGDLPNEFSETLLRQRYGLTSAQLQAVLQRISQEGWAHKKAGYGWAFSPMLTTPESLLQSYRLRLALEPAALLEPDYFLDPQILERCRAAELHLLGGGIKTDSADEIHARGVRFHEAIVEACGNPFFIDTVRRVNRVRRLLSYRSTTDRKRFRQHCEQHLEVLELLEQGKNQKASTALANHLRSTLVNLASIAHVLKA